ncbi:hypothetical protein C8J57DRAFT_1489179 [Mycena rebaudengoi]|nr:hypothetical protein C8J57DRAFT_1489179 [Mycena rebaudengoi]
MLRLTFVVALVALFAGATAQDQVLCAAGACFDSPNSAISNGCDFFEGGVDAWETCALQGAVTCTKCLACSTDACYSSPTQATGTGCTQWAGGVDATETCGFDGALLKATLYPPFAIVLRRSNYGMRDKNESSGNSQRAGQAISGRVISIRLIIFHTSGWAADDRWLQADDR